MTDRTDTGLKSVGVLILGFGMKAVDPVDRGLGQGPSASTGFNSLAVRTSTSRAHMDLWVGGWGRLGHTMIPV